MRIKLQTLVGALGILFIATLLWCSNSLVKRSEVPAIAGIEKINVSRPAGMLDPIIKGTLKLIDNDTYIQADLWLKVSSTKFKQGKLHHEFEEGPDKLRGIVFNYYNSDNPSICDIGDKVDEKHIVYKFRNKYGWKENDNVRVMCLNEISKTDYNQLKPYFAERIREFRYRDDVADFENITFISGWNGRNGSNLINVCDSLSGYEYLHRPFREDDIPRFTKDDGVLSISR